MNKYRKRTLKQARAAGAVHPVAPRDYINIGCTYQISGADLQLLQEALFYSRPQVELDFLGRPQEQFCGLEPAKQKLIYTAAGNVVARAMAKGPL